MLSISQSRTLSHEYTSRVAGGEKKETKLSMGAAPFLVSNIKWDSHRKRESV